MLISYEDIRQLQRANKLLNIRNESLNSKFADLKLKPLDLNKEFIANNASLNSSVEQMVRQAPSQEQQAHAISIPKTIRNNNTKTIKEAKKPNLLLQLLLLAVVFVMGMNANLLISMGTGAQHKTLPHKQQSRGALNIIDLDSKPVFLSSGPYLTVTEVEKAKAELRPIAGSALKIIKTKDNLYNIQIGPSYEDYEDAMIVFQGLSKYSVKNLSIQVKS